MPETVPSTVDATALSPSGTFPSGTLTRLRKNLRTQAGEALAGSGTEGHGPSDFTLEALEPRLLMSGDGAVPAPEVLLNDFNGDTMREVAFLMSGHESRRMHLESGHLIMGVRDTLVSGKEYEPTAKKPLEISLTANFPKADSLYILTRTEGTKEVGGYRSKNEVRTEIDLAGKAIRISEVQGGSMKTIAELQNVELPLHQNLKVNLKDDGSTIRVSVEQYTLSGNTKGTYRSNKTGIAGWAASIEVDDYLVTHGERKENPVALITEHPADAGEMDAPSLFEGLEEVDFSTQPTTEQSEEERLLHLAADLQSQYKFRVKGKLYFNEHKRSEYELFSDTLNDWVIILPNGDFLKPGAGYPFLFHSDPAFHKDLSLLLNAEENLAAYESAHPRQPVAKVQEVSSPAVESSSSTVRDDDDTPANDPVPVKEDPLISLQINSQALQNLQGSRLLERSSFAIHGEDVQGIVQRTYPDLFPENLQEEVQRQALGRNDEAGHIQERILKQRSQYVAIARDLLHSYDDAMGRLLNQAVAMTARVQAGESEYENMQQLRSAVAREKGMRYLTELASFGVHLPSAEELYREGQRLFTEEQSLLRRMQSEQGRLQDIENFRASDDLWQVAHGASDTDAPAGEELGGAGNGYQGTLDDGESRRLGRAERLWQLALGVPSGGSTSGRQTVVLGASNTVVSPVRPSPGSPVKRTPVYEQSVSVDVSSPIVPASADASAALESVDRTVATGTLSRWYATAGEGSIDIDWSVEAKAGNYALTVQGFETWNVKEAILVVDGSREIPLARTASGFRTRENFALSRGQHVLTLKGVGVPGDVGVHPGRLMLMNMNNLAPTTEADIQTLLVADHPEMKADRIFRIQGEKNGLHGVQQLIEKFAPILHFTEGEDFPMPYPVDGYDVPKSGDANAEVNGICAPENATPTIYASVLEEGDELAINYYFFYPMSNWGDHDGFNTHEGDWEGVTVFLKKENDAYVPERVAFAQHEKIVTSKFDLTDGRQRVSWNDTLKNDSRVSVYVGKGGHSSYPYPGKDYWPMSETHGNDVRIKSAAIEYLPRITSLDAPAWLRYPGFWGSSDLGGIHEPGNFQGDGAPRGPFFLSSGFPMGERNLKPWDWTDLE